VTHCTKATPGIRITERHHNFTSRTDFKHWRAVPC